MIEVASVDLMMAEVRRQLQRRKVVEEAPEMKFLPRKAWESFQKATTYVVSEEAEFWTQVRSEKPRQRYGLVDGRGLRE
jgi:hypothetical protein